jgi:hypothetical protein
MFTRLKAWAAAAAVVAAVPAHGIELAEGKLSIAGFGRWGYGNTDGNVFLVGRDDGKADAVGVALNTFARPTDRLVVSAQFFYDTARINVDWAFAEWRFHDALRFRAGQVKLPFGAYWEVKDVGTLRPFYNLPVSIYSYADVAAESFYGVGLNGSLPTLAAFDVSYDVFGGSVWLESNDRFRAAPAAPTGPVAASPTAGPVTASTRLDETFGGRLTVGTPLPGLTLRLSGYRGEVADLGNQVQGAGPAGAAAYAYGVSAEYLGEWLEVRSEGFRKSEGRGATRQKIQTGYLEVAVRFLRDWQVAGRAESATYDVAGFTATPFRPNSLRRHQELAAGLNYWFNRDFVLKASYHVVDGNRFAVPEYAWNTLTTDGLQGAGPPPNPADVRYDSDTRLLLFGAQFSF